MLIPYGEYQEKKDYSIDINFLRENKKPTTFNHQKSFYPAVHSN